MDHRKRKGEEKMAEEFEFFTGSMDDMSGIGTQKSLHMIFLVDNSGSMRGGGRMDAVNEAFQRMIPALQKMQEQVQDAFTIYLSILAFNEDPEWVTTPAEIAYYVHSPIAASQYVTYYSRAFQELNQKLSRSEFLGQGGKMAAPYIMLLTDGAPTEGDDYETALEELKHNAWFKLAQRYAVLIGADTINDPNARRAVSSFVDGNEEGILDAADAEAIAQSVSAKTIIIMDQMTKRRGVAGGEEIQKGKDADPYPDFGTFPGGEDPDVLFPDFDTGDTAEGEDPFFDPDLQF